MNSATIIIKGNQGNSDVVKFAKEFIKKIPFDRNHSQITAHIVYKRLWYIYLYNEAREFGIIGISPQKKQFSIISDKTPQKLLLNNLV